MILLLFPDSCILLWEELKKKNNVEGSAINRNKIVKNMKKQFNVIKKDAKFDMIFECFVCFINISFFFVFILYFYFTTKLVIINESQKTLWEIFLNSMCLSSGFTYLKLWCFFFLTYNLI